jgi:hypothetical protein
MSSKNQDKSQKRIETQINRTDRDLREYSALDNWGSTVNVECKWRRLFSTTNLNSQKLQKTNRCHCCGHKIYE